MTNEWNLDAEGDDRTRDEAAGSPDAVAAGSGTAGDAEPHPFSRPSDAPADSTSTDSAAAAEHTSILPGSAGTGTAGVAGVAVAEPATAPRRRTGSLSAAVLVGALVLGGAAGVGGAAAYDALNGPDSSTTAGNGDFQASDSSASATSQVTGTVAGVAKEVLPSVVQVNVVGDSAQGTGSGIILSSDGTILTNNHVASAVSGGTLSVRFNDGKVAAAKVVGTDPVTDLAVIQAENVSGLTAATLGKSSDLAIGQQVVAIGSPEGLSATVTSGIVSALNRAVSISSGSSGGQGDSSNPFLGQQQQQGSTSSQTTTYPAIQTDASINEGNSGGPLVNMAGQVVGINSAIKTSGDSTGSIGIGFSIPMDEALPIINQIRKGETPTHARLGVTVSDNAATKTPDGGALVQTVTAGDAGAAAGLKKGDVVTKLDDHLIEGSDDLVASVRGDRPGQKVQLTILRDGKEQTLTATLGSDAKTASS